MGALLELIVIGTHFQGLRTGLVAGHQRQREQQFVLDQPDQVERACEREHIFVAFGINRCSLLFSGDEPETSTRLHGRFHRLQAALTHQRQPGTAFEMQPDLRFGAFLQAAFPPRAPLHLLVRSGLGIGVRFAAQAIQQSQGTGSGLVATLLRKGSDIHAAGVEPENVHASILGRRPQPPGTAGPMGQSPAMHTPPLILGSTSMYRRELLGRLRIPFEVVAPDVDESQRAGERPVELARRLAMAKARAVAVQHPEAVVIGSDQVAELDGVAVGKPGNHQRATEQLRAMSGREVVFHTAVAVACVDRGFEDSDLARVTVRFRHLGDDEIERYLQTERPYDCAGSAKSEALGIALLQAVVSDDPTALIGLPLIRTCALLRRAGIDPLGAEDRRGDR